MSTGSKACDLRDDRQDGKAESTIQVGKLQLRTDRDEIFKRGDRYLTLADIVLGNDTASRDDNR